MSKIRYYCSGWEKEKPFPADLIEYLGNDIRGFEKILFVPTDFSHKEKIEKNSIGLTDTFNRSGLSFKKIIVLNENMSKEEMYNHIQNSNLVFLMGGNPTTQLEIIKDFDLEEAFRKTDAVLMGMSAGAMCMSEYSMLLPVNEKYPNMEIKEGMNLSDISIYPHYNSNGEVPEILTVDTEQTKKSDLLYASNNYGSMYLLSDNTEIREENGTLTFIGANIIYLNGNEFKLISSGETTKKR